MKINNAFFKKNNMSVNNRIYRMCGVLNGRQ